MMSYVNPLQPSLQIAAEQRCEHQPLKMKSAWIHGVHWVKCVTLHSSTTTQVLG